MDIRVRLASWLFPERTRTKVRKALSDILEADSKLPMITSPVPTAFEMIEAILRSDKPIYSKVFALKMDVVLKRSKTLSAKQYQTLLQIYRESQDAKPTGNRNTSSPSK